MNMEEQYYNRNYLYGFLALYGLTYMCNAVYNTFIPLYLNNAGFSRTALGILMSLGPFVAILAQPLWGLAGDRSASKNNVLKVLIAGSAGSILLYGWSTSFVYLFFIIALFTFFQTSVNPMSDAITLECAEKGRWKFGHIRLAGTVGYALMALTAGVLTRHNLSVIFPLYAFLALCAFGTVHLLPSVQGHQKKGSKMSILVLFRNRKLVILMLFNLVVQITLSYYYSFFAIHYRQLGADNVMLGWSQLASALSELPFLLFADRIIKRFGTEYVLAGSAAFTGLRWLLLYSVTDIHTVIFVNMLHGMNFIVFQFSMATYINKNVPRELRASGQTINGLLGLGIARIIGSIAGGVTSDLTSIRQTFLYDSLLAFTAVVVFGSYFISQRLKAGRENP